MPNFLLCRLFSSVVSLVSFFCLTWLNSQNERNINRSIVVHVSSYIDAIVKFRNTSHHPTFFSTISPQSNFSSKQIMHAHLTLTNSSIPTPQPKPTTQPPLRPSIQKFLPNPLIHNCRYDALQPRKINRFQYPSIESTFYILTTALF